jgi:hypothetical protein
MDVYQSIILILQINVLHVKLPVTHAQIIPLVLHVIQQRI